MIVTFRGVKRTPQERGEQDQTVRCQVAASVENQGAEEAGNKDGKRLDGAAGVAATAVEGTGGRGRSLCRNQGPIVLDQGKVSDGLTTSMNRTGTTSQEASDHGTTVTQGTPIGTNTTEVKETRETDTLIEKGIRSGGERAQGDSAAGRTRTTRLQTTSYSGGLASSKSQLKRNPKKVRFR